MVWNGLQECREERGRMGSSGLGRLRGQGEIRCGPGSAGRTWVREEEADMSKNRNASVKAWKLEHMSCLSQGAPLRIPSLLVTHYSLGTLLHHPLRLSSSVFLFSTLSWPLFTQYWLHSSLLHLPSPTGLWATCGQRQGSVSLTHLCTHSSQSLVPWWQIHTGSKMYTEWGWGMVSTDWLSEQFGLDLNLDGGVEWFWAEEGSP